jgi:hypothetical protein
MSSMVIPSASVIAFAEYSLPPDLPVSIWEICEYDTPGSRAKSPIGQRNAHRWRTRILMADVRIAAYITYDTRS